MSKRPDWRGAAAVLRKHAVEFDAIAEQQEREMPTGPDAIKVAVCEYLLKVNQDMDGPFIPPTAIDWLGDGIVTAVLAVES